VRIRSLIAVASVLSITVAAEAAYAVPTRTIREVRAARCCATRCQRQNHAVAPAARCCGVQRAAAEVATLSASAKPSPAFLVGFAGSTAGGSADRTDVPALGRSEPVPRAGPVFLLTRSLRL